MNSVSGVPSTAPPAAVTPQEIKPARLSALDAWRGLTVLLMLLVNNVALGGKTPYQLVHAPFGGLTLTDLVFPWFLLCAGAALPFSLAALNHAGIVGWSRVRRLVTRAALLYLAGAFLTSVTLYAPTLGLGVLQLIALSTLCAALLGSLRGKWQATLTATLLLGYAAFLTLTPRAAGLGIVSEMQNPVQMLNDVVLTPIGLRGLISVIPTTALVLLGSLAARPLQQRDARAPLKLLGLGLLLSILGFGWAASGHILFSKALWTPPYILYSAGLGILGMLVFWLIADSGRLRFGARLLAPLTIPGRNALAGYMLPILIKFWILLAWQVNWTGKSQSVIASLLELSRMYLGNFAGGLVYTLGYVLAVWLGLAWMARRGLIWKL